MRITGGRAKSIPLNCPNGDWVRPATDRMREAVFSSLGSDVEGSVFLDLFAGSGSYGLEAISRGSIAGVFVEQHRLAVQSIQRNLDLVVKSVGNHDKSLPYSVQSADVFKWMERKCLPRGYEGYDIVFIDPPYREVEGSFHRLLSELTALLHPAKGAWILFESPVLIESYPPGYALRKAFGKGREDTRAMLLSWVPGRL